MVVQVRIDNLMGTVEVELLDLLRYAPQVAPEYHEPEPEGTLAKPVTADTFEELLYMNVGTMLQTSRFQK